jgi:hypothetical protein
MKRKTPAPSLFNRDPPADGVPATAENIRRYLDAATPTNAWSAFVDHLEATCKAAEMDPSVPDGKGHAKRIRQGVRLLRGMVRDGVSKEALALAAIDVGQSWMALRVDVHAAAAIDAEKRRRPQLTVTDEQIYAAVESEKTKKAAAEKLGISERQLRNRLAVRQ